MSNVLIYLLCEDTLAQLASLMTQSLTTFASIPEYGTPLSTCIYIYIVLPLKTTRLADIIVLPMMSTRNEGLLAVHLDFLL